VIPLRDENPTSTVPFVTYGLVAANVFVFAYTLMLGAEAEGFVQRYAVVPARLLSDGQGFYSGIHTPLSSMFLHGNLLHVGGNVLYLWIFGDNVEDSLGHARFLLFYAACGVAAAGAHMLSAPGSALPMIGASGAVSGVLGAYILLFPRARVWTFFFFVFFWQVARVPALVLIGLWILIQVANGLTSFGQQSGGVAWFAHIGGFAAGMALVVVLGGMRRRAARRR
jgi:membrane associated rhomboid family serine protease